MSLWKNTIPASQPCPILKSAAEAKQAKALDASVIDSTVGVYKDEDGKTYMYDAVKKAFEELHLESQDHAYGPVLGRPGYRKAMRELLGFSDTDKVAVTATTGGSGAVYLSALFMAERGKKIMSPEPTYVNYTPTVELAGTKLDSVPYLDSQGNATAEPTIDYMKRYQHEVALLLQAGAHNPTGKDFTRKQWEEIAEAAAKHGVEVILDSAYIGLADGLEEDLYPLQTLRKAGVSTFNTASGAKNHGLYDERPGALLVPCETDSEVQAMEGFIAGRIRPIHSSSAATAQRIVEIVQQKYPHLWKPALPVVREMVDTRKRVLKDVVPEELLPYVISKGPYMKFPFDAHQIEVMKQNKLHPTPNGRINVGGVTLEEIQRARKAIEAAYMAGR
jgi:aspartate aminotransferase